VRREGTDVLLSLAERRQADREDAEPVPEVAPELARRDHRGQIAMGRRDDPDVRAERPLPSDALKGPVLQDAQQPDLRRLRQLAYLVEEKGAGVGPLEPSLPRRDRAGEAALLMPEELGVDELGRDGAAVDPEDRARRAGGAVVNRARHDLLSGARLAGDEHRHVGRRGAEDQVHDRAEPLLLADHDRPAAGRGRAVAAARHRAPEVIRHGGHVSVIPDGPGGRKRGRVGVHPSGP